MAAPLSFDPAGVLSQATGRMVDPVMLAEELRRQQEEQQRQAQAAQQQSQSADSGALADAAGLAVDVGGAAVDGVTQAVKDYVEPRTYRTLSDSVLGRGSDGWTSTPMDLSAPLPTETVGTMSDLAAGATNAAPDIAEAAATGGGDILGTVGGAVLDGLGSVVEGLFSWG